MEKISLPGGRETTRLGFGTSSVMGALGWGQSLRMLEAAYEAGIRHFDTAPMYGFGEAERCVGEFLGRHSDATVTTKFGIPAPVSGTGKKLVRAVMRLVVQAFPGLKKRLQRGSGTPAAAEVKTVRVVNPIFTVENARASLENSLRALKLERIDVWLLHDVDAMDLKDDSLLRFAEEAVAAGKIGCFGVGTDRDRIPRLLQVYPGYCPVTQYEWSVFNPEVEYAGAFRIHHRALSENFSGLVELLRGRPEDCRRWSEEVGADLGDSRVLARLMLKASYEVNAGSVVLFSSKDAGHIRGNVGTVGDGTLVEPARRLYGVFQRERVTV